MANAVRGEVGIEIEGKKYTLRPTFNALCDLEEQQGKTFIEVAQAAGRGSAVAVRQLVWCYLQEHHGDEIKTVRDAGNWVSRAGGIERVNEALQRLIDLNSSDGGKDGSDRPQEAQSG